MSPYSFEDRNQLEFEAEFKFKPLSFSWIAIHPKPKGIIQFIGGALFGSFPTIFYNYFLTRLFKEGYTIIALPFRFTFDHWSVSLQLLREQYVLRKAIIEEVKRLNYNPTIYLEDKNYRWVGHSLGCKYIILLELLSTFEENSINTFKEKLSTDDNNDNNSEWEKLWQENRPKAKVLLPPLKKLSNDIEEEKLRQYFIKQYCQNFTQQIEKENKDCQQSLTKIENQLNNLKNQVKDIYDEWIEIRKAIAKLVEEDVDLNRLFIRDQPSLLIAPDISDTSSAIPILSVAKIIDRIGWGAKPTKSQTRCLVRESSLFSITSIISFEKDMIAGNLANLTGDSDVAWLACTLKSKGGNNRIKQIDNAYHLEPHGHQIGNFVVDLPGCIIVWVTGLTFLPLSPFSSPAKAFSNEVRKSIIKSIQERQNQLDLAIINLLQP
jgi:Protein of unknown function (DUF1350)